MHWAALYEFGMHGAVGPGTCLPIQSQDEMSRKKLWLQTGDAIMDGDSVGIKNFTEIDWAAWFSLVWNPSMYSWRPF
jgi:hypothetical protein